MSIPTCIYCKSQTNPFNREHVIPEAFGTFQSNWHLNDCVCRACNQYFGDTIELVLTRDTPEALLRFEYGLKSASKAHELHYDKTTLKVEEPGPWYGAWFQFVPDSIGQKKIPRPLGQVGLRKKSDLNCTWLREHEITLQNVERFKGGTPGDLEIRVLGSSAEESKRLIEKLNDSGINFSNPEQIREPLGVDGKLNAQISSIADSSVLRAVSKIAFNYVAYVQGPRFVLESDFDDLRNYIRYETEMKWRAVLPSTEPLLADEPRGYQVTHGHLITFDWDSEDRGLFAQVSLFNTVVYQIKFCRFYSGVWRSDMNTGHLFDIESRSISSLRATRLRAIAHQ